MIRRENLRDIVFGVFSAELALRGFDLVLSIIGFGKLFLPLASIIYSHPGIVVNFFGVEEQISLVWLLLMVALTTTLVSYTFPKSSTKEQISITVLFLSGIAAYRLRINMFEILFYAIGVLTISTIARVVFLEEEWDSGLGKSSKLTAIALVFGLTWGLIDSLLFLPELILGFIGFSLLYRRFRGKSQNVPRFVGLEDRLYRSSTLLLQSSTGVAAMAVIYLSLFSSIVIFPHYPVPIEFDYLFSLRPLSLVVNIGGGLFSPIFYFLIFYYWFSKLLPRAVHSADYWENGYRKGPHTRLIARPSILSIGLPTVGWILTRIPAWLGREIYVGSSIWLVALFSLQLVCFTLTILEWGGYLRRFWSSPLDQSVKSDHLPFSAAMVSLLVMHLPVSKFTALFVAISSFLLVFEWWFESGSVPAVGLAISSLLVFSIIEMPNEIALKFWSVFMTFLMAYLLVQFTNGNLTTDFPAIRETGAQQ